MMQLTNFFQVFCFVSVCQKAIMADFDKSIGQCMEQKTSDKLNRFDGGLLELLSFTVLVCKGYAGIFKGNQTIIGYGDPMRIAAEIFKHILATFDWFLSVNDPLVGIK